MPSLKRHLLIDHEQPYEDADHSNIRINAATNSLKRARLSIGALSDEGSVTSDDGSQKTDSPRLAWAKESRITTDTQSIAENGIIESVTCSNFMCHGFLHVDIGPMINFIIGHNGSGKSAVLTALTISLGGKASSTNRGGSLKSFIKEGQDSCTLSVKIKNQGETAYQPDIYGNSIIVERTFNRAGASGFKLKSSAGKMISAKRSDLEDISDYFALQIDNPISVLTQDMARSFLAGSSSQEKYKFFVKGVQLEQLHHDYQLLEESIEQAEAAHDDKKAQLLRLKERESEAKKLLDLIGKQDDVRARMRSLAVQMAWSQVVEQERELQRILSDIEESGELLSETQRREESATRDLENAKDRERKASDELDLIEKQKVPLIHEKNRLKELSSVAKTESLDAMRQQRKIGDDIKSRREAIMKAQQDVDIEMKRLDDLEGGQHARRVKELEQCEDEVVSARARVEEHMKRLPGLDREKKAAEVTCENLQAARLMKTAELEESQSRLQSLSKESQQKQGYPQKIESLLRAIAANSEFREKPVGPLGNYIHLKDAIWSGILEKSFGASLNGFIVTSKPDHSKLLDLMQSLKCSCPIYISSKANINVSQNEPSKEFQTVLRILRIDHPLVMQELVINYAIEQTILIEEMSKARDVMVNQCLQKVKQCFSIHSADTTAGMRFSFGAANSIQSSYMEGYKGHPRMRVQKQDQISHETKTQDRLAKELFELEQHVRERRGRVVKCEQALAKHVKDSKNLRIALQEAEHRLGLVQDVVDMGAGEEGRLDALKEDLARSSDELALLERTYQECIITKDKYQADMKALQLEMGNIDEKTKIIQRKIEKAQIALQRETSTRTDCLSSRNELCEQIERNKETKSELEDQRQQQEAIVADFSEKAKSVGPRVSIEDGETTSSIDAKLAKLDAEVKKSEASIGGDKQKIAEKFAVASQLCHQAVTQSQQDEALLQLLKKTHFDRTFRWEQFRKRITARARIMFTHFLSERSFQGKLVINHKERLLDMNIQPDETQRDRVGRQAKTLSGGEKSFSQICLLLSLWEAIGAPIRCLDEFDVFMDSVNREASLRLLIRAARDARNRQFMLITPQSMASIDRQTDIKIIKMQDPERNQSTISRIGDVILG